MNQPMRHAAMSFRSWLDANQHLLVPPVANRQIWENTDLMVTVVGGPNQRTDFHDDPIEEFFYQFKGDALVKITDNGDFYDVRLHEGDIFFAPPHLRHSPQRPVPGSLCLVVEYRRPPGQLDGFEWYCFNCQALVHRVEIAVRDLVRDLPPLFNAFYGDERARTCSRCNTLHPGKDPPAGWVVL